MEKYISQKAQKIVSALYLITDLIKDSDALKWEIREEGISFVSDAILFNTTLPIEREHASSSFFSSAEKIVSFLRIADVSSMISKMNITIVVHEIESLTEFIKKSEWGEGHPPGYILSDSFFATDTPLSIDKGQRNVLRTSDMARNKTNQVKDRKNERQENIINMLKKDSNLTIKDFAKVIRGCSEKTIQRELLLLVEKGVIKKVGERRWSTYSLV
ncbi:MAG TPA: DeoR family transcriptional regulator [Candidatus Paceibacterota bacterium]